MSDKKIQKCVLNKFSVTKLSNNLNGFQMWPHFTTNNTNVLTHFF